MCSPTTAPSSSPLTRTELRRHPSRRDGARSSHGPRLSGLVVRAIAALRVLAWKGDAHPSPTPTRRCRPGPTSDPDAGGADVGLGSADSDVDVGRDLLIATAVRAGPLPAADPLAQSPPRGGLTHRPAGLNGS